MKKLSDAADLTTGSPAKVIAMYTFPMLGSMFFQQAYNLADSWIAGNFVGADALAAVGTCYPVTVFYIAIASGLSMGTSIFCSQNFGAHKYQDVACGMTTALFSFIPFSIVLTCISYLFYPYMLSWLSVPAEAYEPTSIYLRIYIAGLPFLFLYNICNGIISGLGNSRTPLLFLIFSSIFNLTLDFFLVILLDFGIVGISMTTLLAQAASAIAACIVTYRFLKRMHREQTEVRWYSKSALREILSLGIPSVCQHVFMSAGQLFLQSIINSYGMVVMAGYSVAFRINGIVINSLMAVSNALSGYMAQNMGAKKFRRMHQGYGICLLISCIFSAAVIVVLRFSDTALLSMFLKDSPDKAKIIEAGQVFLRIVAPFYLLVSLKIVSDGALRGMGAMTLFMLATLSDVVVRILFGRFFSDQWGISGVWMIWPAAWLVGTAISFGTYLVKCRKFKNMPLNNSAE